MLSDQKLRSLTGNKLGKPSGITLYDHTRHVVAEARKVLRAWPLAARKYERLTGLDLEEMLLLAAQIHDLGKMHPIWQQACQKDYQTHLRTGRDNGEALRTAGLRHEFASAMWITKQKESFPKEVLAAVAAHHGKLSTRFLHRWENDNRPSVKLAGIGKKGPYYTLYQDFVRWTQRAETTNEQWTDFVRLRYRFDAVRSLLRLADTRASRRESSEKNYLVDLAPFTAPKAFPSLRPVQQAVMQRTDRMRTILRAPTGGGKTHAAYLWADAQINGEVSRADRMIIAMPTRFTANALAQSTDGTAGKIGLYHSSAFNKQFGAKRDPKKSTEQKSREAEIHKYARWLAWPVTVCTIDHLMLILTGSQEHHHDAFLQMAHACVVFDEVDFYDPFVQANLKVLLDALKALEVPVLVMSATVPDVAREQYGFEDPILIATRGAEQRAEKRIVFSGQAETPDDCRSVLDRMLSNGKGIIYANTVARAMAYYAWLEEQPAVKRGEVPVFLYHSYFTEPDKVRKEREITDALGKEATNKSTARGIVVLTQIGEMSINISTDLMLTDACPWDRLAQRVGRLARFTNETSGEVVVVAPTKDEKPYPPPYAKLHRGKNWRWESWPAYDATLDDLRSLPEMGRLFDADYLVERVNALYPTVSRPTESIIENVRRYHSLIRDNWLITPKSKNLDDNGEVAGKEAWSTRDIGSQISVTNTYLPRFRTWDEYREHQLQYGISVPAYRADSRKGRPSIIQTVQIKIGEEDPDENGREVTETSYYVPAGNYDSQVGLYGLFGFKRNHEDDLL